MSTPSTETLEMDVGGYLFDRVCREGVTHTFGIPGDFALPLYAAQERAGLRSVVMTHEPSAGYAADVYGRLRGMGVAIVTYGVGTLNMVNAVAMAYAEQSPLLVIAGAPEVGWQKADSMFHHRVKSPDTQLRVMREVTAAQASITDAGAAPRQIDEVFDAIRRYSRPGFIEVARDLTFAPVSPPAAAASEAEAGHAEALAEAVGEIVARLNAAQKPVIYAGVEVERFGQMADMRRLVEKLHVPVATSLMGKAVLPEDHPNFVGNYFGSIGPDSVREYIESADCVLALGILMSDLDVGFDPTRIGRKNLIQATSDGVSVSYHRYPGITLGELIGALLDSEALVRHADWQTPRAKAAVAPAAGWGTGDVITELNRFLTPQHIVIADTGDCLFASVELRASSFIAPGYYASMGLAVPGAIGAQMARPDLRPVVLLGDGAFKMDGVELGTARDLGLNPIVVLLNNRSFATLRAADRDRDYYRVRSWDYIALARALGGDGAVVNDTAGLRQALRTAEASRDFFVIEVTLPDGDASPTLLRLGKEYGGRIRQA